MGGFSYHLVTEQKKEKDKRSYKYIKTREDDHPLMIKAIDK